jgi:signal transduction histidine kinase/CheY-like chemotaxis protein/HPt (histidine-containing phosphotransfer) domain-containing protein
MRERLWRLRTFDYSDLRFLYIACLLTIALVYTIFRTSQFFMNLAEVKALDAVQQIDGQRDLTAEMERLIAFAQNRTSFRYAEIVDQLYKTYSTIESNQRLISTTTVLSRECRNRECGKLFVADFFKNSPQHVLKELKNPRLGSRRHSLLLQNLFADISEYRGALRDMLAVSFNVIRAKNRTNLTFEITAYFALIALLLTQAIYIFRPAIRRLNASLSVRSDFLSRISHEIRNPMNSIIGMADILRGTRLNYEQQQYVGNLIRSGNALLDMLNNLIDFSVIEGGRLTLKSAPFDLFQSLDRDINLISITAHHKNLNVYVDIDPRVPNRLIGDATRLDQVLVNLLNNAVKFTEQGHILLKVDLISEKDGSAQLQFSVADTGIGIRPEQMGHVFESFVQGDSSIQRRYGGSGLGLSISREILRLMGGTLELESTLGQGSRFYFTLSFNKQAPRENIPVAPLTQLHDRRFVLLTADPEREVYSAQFTRLAPQFSILQSARQLVDELQIVGTRPIDGVLIDDSIGIVSMINCRNTAAREDLGDHSIALIRSNFTKERMDLLRRNGFTRFLIKPFKPWELLTAARATEEEEDLAPAEGGRGRSLEEQLKAKRLKILLVDDSNDNLFLLKELINPIAASVHFAENGLEAIEKFKRQNYDAVFMDIQMPVMDGYTAIGKMREIETAAGRHIPIFAVTAHSGLVDAQRCREAGFTDHIVKPVVRNSIYDSLARALGLSETEPESFDNPDLPPQYFAKLMPTYFRTRAEDLEKIHRALDNEDFKTLKALGHKIKGSSASFDFPQTSELSLNLEQAALAGDLAECRNVVQQLEGSIRADRARRMPSSPPHPDTTPTDIISPDATS